jgi:small subunit ribosomal protein S4
MVTKTESACKKCRREGQKLFLKGQRCETPKCAIQKRNYQPGVHPWTRGRPSEYRIHLREKQKTKRFYGVRDKQFKIYMKNASRAGGNTGENLLIYLERRLDNVVFSLGFAKSRRHARQMVCHGHLLLNGRKCDIPSALVGNGDAVSVREKENVRKIAGEALEQNRSRGLPPWLELDAAKMSGSVKELPMREHVQFDVDEQLIVELMSK